jgi:hypothetical protein
MHRAIISENTPFQDMTYRNYRYVFPASASAACPVKIRLRLNPNRLSLGFLSLRV